MNIKELIEKEVSRQEEGIILIASENYTSSDIRAAAGTCLTNKYSEGYPSARYYSGNEIIDQIEIEAIERAKELFGMDHVNVQPHSGSTANQAVYLAAIKPGDKIMGLALDCGGHLTHGHRATTSGKLYDVVHYTVDPKTQILDYDAIQKQAELEQPKLIICGATAYSRSIDFARFREIADSVGALLLADISHIAGLVAAGLHQSPSEFADFVTTTTHKTLCGPRGAIVMCKSEWAKKINSAVFPGLQGGPMNHIIAAKALAFQFALTDEFKDIQKRTIANAKAMEEVFKSRGIRLVADGTDNHLLILDLSDEEVSATDAVNNLELQKIYTNFNTVPFDKSVINPSGIRIGTPAISTRSMSEAAAASIAECMVDIIRTNKDCSVLINEIVSKFPISCK